MAKYTAPLPISQASLYFFNPSSVDMTSFFSINRYLYFISSSIMPRSHHCFRICSMYIYEGKKHRIPSGTIPARPINNLPYDVATLVSERRVYSELRGSWSYVRPMMSGLMGLRPIWMLIDLAITG